MKLSRVLSTYRWPIFLGGILAMSVIANGVMVYVATQPDAPRPIPNYYERGLEWDADQAAVAAGERLGWSVTFEVPAGEEYSLGAPRPVDLTVRDRDDQPVTGLTGKLIAVRPADSRLGGESTLVELPHDPGHYRSMARFSEAGLWELSLDAHRDDTRFVFTERVVIDRGNAP